MHYYFSSIRNFIVACVFILQLTACGGDVNYIIVAPPYQGKVLEINFNDGIDGWKTGFADYPAGQENFYELTSGIETLPDSLGINGRKGLKISGNNHSDDLFMFATKQFNGLEPNTRYDIDFEVSFASNAKTGCTGVGGSPGESVAIKVGAIKNEPLAVNNGAGNYLMNIDKGNQQVGGSDAIVVGNFANGRDCENADNSYLKKTVRSERGSFSTFTDAEGALWILFSTDSGFESTTTIYFIDAKIVAKKR